MIDVDGKIAEHVAKQIYTAAEINFTKIDPRQKQEYISEETWKLINEKEEAIKNGDYNQVRTIKNKLKFLIKQEKQCHSGITAGNRRTRIRMGWTQISQKRLHPQKHQV